MLHEDTKIKRHIWTCIVWMQAVNDFQFLPLPLILSEQSFEGGVVIRDPFSFSAVLISLLLLWQTW